MKLATAVPLSQNAKIGQASATYLAQASCPQDCPLLGHGCYAELGNTWAGFTTDRLNKATKKLKRYISPVALARAEAREIKNKLKGHIPLRLHVVGDARTPRAAEILADAVKGFSAAVWTYTHAWRRVKRAAWGRVSALASVEKVEDLDHAHAQGYAPALVVTRHPKNGKAHKHGEWTLIPCPAQTRKVTCVDCKLCWNGDALRQRKAAITFEVHGGGQVKAAQALVQLRLIPGA